MARCYVLGLLVSAGSLRLGKSGSPRWLAFRAWVYLPHLARSTCMGALVSGGSLAGSWFRSRLVARYPALVLLGAFGSLHRFGSALPRWLAVEIGVYFNRPGSLAGCGPAPELRLTRDPLGLLQSAGSLSPNGSAQSLWLARAAWVY